VLLSCVSLQMRQTIKAVFPDRDVSVMVRPALTEADLQKLDSLHNASLRPEFRKVRGPTHQQPLHVCQLWQQPPPRTLFHAIKLLAAGAVVMTCCSERHSCSWCAPDSPVQTQR
jgi:hypothetical protein